MVFGKVKADEPTGRKKTVAIISVASVLLAIGLFFLIPRLINRYEAEKRSYSGAPVNLSEQLLFDTEELIKMKGVRTDKKPDGTYMEEVISEDGAISVLIMRDLERPRMSCGDLAKESYPGLTSLRSVSKDDQPDIVTERVSFSVSDGKGGEQRHTAVLLRRSGWDYLVDFAVKEGDGKSWDYIDTLIGHLFFM